MIWKGHCERGARAARAFHRNRAAVQIDDAFSDGKAKA